MFCEIAEDYGFLAVWVTMTITGLVSVLILSGILFVPYYVRPRYVPQFDFFRIVS